MSIYTHTGDTGSTSLFGGKRILKCEQLLDVLNNFIVPGGSELGAITQAGVVETVWPGGSSLSSGRNTA